MRKLQSTRRNFVKKTFERIIKSKRNSNFEKI